MSQSDIALALKSFDAQNRLNEDNYGAWSREIDMTFVLCPDFVGHLDGTIPMPTGTNDSTDALAKWLAKDREVIATLYKTIASNAIRTNHIKSFSATPRQTAKEVWDSLKQAFVRDSRALRFELKRRLYNPIHDPSLPVMDYINDIVNAHSALSDLGHSPPSVDVSDSILMHLHPSFDIVRSSLVTQSTEPSLETIKKVLDDFYRDGKVKEATGGGAGEPHSALYVRKGKDRHRRKSDDSSDDDGDSEYDWGNTRGGDACHRCGRPGHRSSKCIVDMPQKVKDSIIRNARKARRARHAEKENANIAHMESDADSEDDIGFASGTGFGPLITDGPVRANVATIQQPKQEVYISDADFIKQFQPKSSFSKNPKQGR